MHAPISTVTDSIFTFDSSSSIRNAPTTLQSSLSLIGSHQEPRTLIGSNHRSRVTDLFSNNQQSTISDASIFGQPNVQQILRQPISSLRRNRRSQLVLNEGYNEHDLQQSDLLDYIDSIPLGTLESQLLSNSRRETNSRLVSERDVKTRLPNVARKDDDKSFDTDGDRPKHHPMSIELKKPSLDSPSPPKLYRMSMF